MSYRKEIDKHIEIINEHYKIVNDLIDDIKKTDLYYFEIRQQMVCYKNNERFMYGYKPTKNEVICLSRELKQTKTKAMQLRKELDKAQSEARKIKRENEKVIDKIKTREISKIKIDQ